MAFSRPITYPEHFVQRVVTALPNDPEIKGLLESGAVFSVENHLVNGGQTELSQEWRHIFDGRPKADIVESFLGF